ncbi:hypothetical protein IC232_31205 [Microvirga sp. BT688]|uniref:hypothetical protein n=1 Tax=Microvirga sp. TaxID=1873136 RepID=UPI001685674A|nr:hypothetical protein [Microvirga sp.]MBD2751102.1 hypothetical protein [Microvirga sp.]
MPYLVRWQLIAPSKHPLDCGTIQEVYGDYGAAVAAVHEFLRLYPEVQRCDQEAYWLARRSVDADLTVWVWIEQQRDLEALNADKALTLQSTNSGLGPASVMM